MLFRSVASYWLAQYGPDTTIPTDVLSFIFTGNSVSKYGGALGPESGAEFENWFTTDAVCPTDTPFTVTDFKRQYDGWTDYPTGTINTDALFNALAGQNIVHSAYQNVSLTAESNVSYTAGNITYTWSMTEPIPLLGNVWNSFTDPLDEALRPTVEEAYSRPVTVPTPTY